MSEPKTMNDIVAKTIVDSINSGYTDGAAAGFKDGFKVGRRAALEDAMTACYAQRDQFIDHRQKIAAETCAQRISALIEQEPSK